MKVIFFFLFLAMCSFSLVNRQKQKDSVTFKKHIKYGFSYNKLLFK